MNHQPKQAGFGLLEVLITLVLSAIGILGMAAMQTKSIQYTQQSVNRSTAAALASDLMETLRGNRDALYTANAMLKKDSPYLKSADIDIPATEDNCTALNNDCPLAQLQAWKARAQRQLPGVTDALIKSDYHICISKAGDGCSDDGSAIEIKIAWTGRAEECSPNASQNDDTPNICSYILRAEI